MPSKPQALPRLILERAYLMSSGVISINLLLSVDG